MRWMIGALVAVLVAAAPTASAGNAADTRALLQAYPAVQFHSKSVGVARLWGSTFGFGLSPEESAERFVGEHSGVLGVTPAELEPGNHFNDRTTQGVMYDADTDTYRFTLVYYRQVRDGIPVHGADLRLLVRNEPGYPLVHAASSLVTLDGFRVPREVVVAPNVAGAQARVLKRHPDMVNFTWARTVVWPDRDSKPQQPRLATTFIADNGLAATPAYDKRRIIADAETGQILRDESMILNAVSGTVSGYATPDHLADACASEVLLPLPYARVAIGATVAYADAYGNYTIDASGTSITAGIRGLYFDVNNQAGSDLTITQACNPPTIVDFTFNPSPSELTTAQVNAYVEANTVRDMVLAANPSYPTISSQTGFPVNVNHGDTCNAYYDYSSINFFQSGGGCNNTGFGDVVHHEYGHHMVYTGGSGQGAYGEGMSDCQGLFITGRSQLGVGFQSCSSGIRNADNTYQYPCTGAIHDCGQLLSGCVWDLMEELQITEPADWHSIARDLTINSILLHSGDSITPSIATDFLSLDDGSHEAEITTAFGLHNMAPQPPPVNDDIEDAIVICPGAPESGNTSFATTDGSSGCGDSDSSPDVWYVYTPETAGSLTASLCSGTTYDAVLSIHSGTPGTVANELGCDDDGCGSTGGPSSVTIDVAANETVYIRVTGWNGSSGQFTLNLTGPPCAPDATLNITYPNGLPAALTPGQATDFDVQIEAVSGTYATGTGMLHARYDGGAFQTIPLSHVGGDLFGATLPAADCGDTPEFYITAETVGGELVSSPAGAPTTVHTARVGTLVTVLSDDFEDDLGWTTQNLGATSGDWQRGVPVDDPDWEYDPATDADGSGQCYLSQNELGNTDIDSGAVRLVSPVFDLVDGGVTISYDYFLRLTNTDGGIDMLQVEISSNGAAGPWTEIARHDTDGGLYWRHHSITQDDLDAAGVALSGTMQVRFTANDDDPQSITESGLDAFTITTFACQPAPSGCPGDFNCDGSRDYMDIQYFLAALDGESSWVDLYRSQHGGQDPPCALAENGDVDGAGDGTTYFDINPFLTLIGEPCN